VILVKSRMFKSTFKSAKLDRMHFLDIVPGSELAPVGAFVETGSENTAKLTRARSHPVAFSRRVGIEGEPISFARIRPRIVNRNIATVKAAEERSEIWAIVH
jgi:hypothetical protein